MKTVNHFQCFDYMLHCAYNILMEEMIKHFHALLKANTSDSCLEWFHVGEYKQRPNMAGEWNTTPPKQVKKEMGRLLFEYRQKENISFEDIVAFHYCFEKIHPFQDGNGTQRHQQKAA